MCAPASARDNRNNNVGQRPEIAVVVPSHRSRETIGACLDGLVRQTLPSEKFEIHVVDTGSDGVEPLVAERARRWDGRLTYHGADGRGPGRQRNLGVERTAAAFVAFIDSDCVPEPDWLEAGLAHLRQGAAIVQGPTLTPDGSPPPPFAHAIFRRGPSPLFESCNVMYEARAFRDAGGFSVDLFDSTGVHMGEDTELAWRVRRRGGVAAFEPRALVRHRVHPPDYAWHLRYQWQARFFPRLVRRFPELRREALTARVLLGRRSVQFVPLLAGLAGGPRNRAAYVLTLPYLAHLARIGRAGLHGQSPGAAMARVTKHLLSDAVREAALIWGSLRYRSPVL
jgi:glycosyltransferase involved in cell wall biosynthesis